MASNDLKRVGLVFNADGSTDFIRSLKLVNSELQTNYQDFKLVQAQWDKSTSTSQKLTDKLNYLNNAYDIQKDKVKVLKEELEALEKAENKDEVAIQKKKTALSAAEASLQRYQNQIDETSKKLKNGTADIEDYAKKLEDGGKKITDVGKKASVVSAGILAVGTAAVTAGANFEEGMSEVQAISGASGKDLEKLREKAKQMGETTKFSATESANAMYYMALAGWKTEDMLNGIEGVMNLAAASGEDLAMVSDIVTDGLTAMGYSAQESSKFADIFAATVTNANTDVSGLGEAMKYTGSIAGALNLDMEDVSLALGLMANSGVKASQAGTSLRAILQRLSTNTGGARDALESLGVEVFDSEGKMRDFGEIIADMRTKFANLTDEEKTNIAKTVGGTTAMSGFLAIVNSGEEDFNKLSNAIDNSSGAAKDMSDVMMDNLKGDLTLMKSQLEGIAIQLSETLIPIIRKVLDHVSKFLEWLSKLDPQVRNIIIIIAGIVAAIGPLLIVIGKVATGISAILKLIAFLKPIVMGAGAIISGISAPVLAIVAAVAALIAIIVLCIKHWDQIKEVAANCWEGIKSVWQSVSSWFNDNIIKPVTSFFNGMWNGLKNGAKSAWEGIKSIFSTVATFFKDTFTRAWTAVKNVFSIGGKIFDGIKEGITNAFRTIVNGIIGGINRVISIPFNAINNALSIIRNIRFLGISPFKGLIHTFSVPRIPLLAKGGDLLEGSAIVAEAGPELLMQQGSKTKVMPLSNGGGATPTNIIDYDKMTESFTKALNKSKFVLDEDGFVRIVDDRLLKVV